jgi:hypothetical protein
MDKAEKMLKDKFQFKHVTKLAVRNAPAGYVEQMTPGLEGIEIVAGPDAVADALLLFVNSMAEAQALAPGAVATVAAAKPEGICGSPTRRAVLASRLMLTGISCGRWCRMRDGGPCAKSQLTMSGPPCASVRGQCK